MSCDQCDDIDDERDDYEDDTSDPDVGGQWTCVLGVDCLVADPFHHSSECFDLAMAEAMFAEEPPPEPPADDVTLS